MEAKDLGAREFRRFRLATPVPTVPLGVSGEIALHYGCYLRKWGRAPLDDDTWRLFRNLARGAANLRSREGDRLFRDLAIGVATRSNLANGDEGYDHSQFLSGVRDIFGSGPRDRVRISHLAGRPEFSRAFSCLRDGLDHLGEIIAAGADVEEFREIAAETWSAAVLGTSPSPSRAEILADRREEAGGDATWLRIWARRSCGLGFSLGEYQKYDAAGCVRI